MAGKKRASTDGGANTNTRAAKSAKTEKNGDGSKSIKSGKKGGIKTTLAPATFKAQALPLHVNITHTPPVMTSTDPSEDTVSATSADPGFIGAVTLLATEAFNTGSYGWKGNKRVTIEVQDPDDPDGKKEKLHVMITINATVMGSKGAKDSIAKEDANSEEEKDDAVEAEDEE